VLCACPVHTSTAPLASPPPMLIRSYCSALAIRSSCAAVEFGALACRDFETHKSPSICWARSSLIEHHLHLGKQVPHES
jgi:hypothetical protein